MKINYKLLLKKSFSFIALLFFAVLILPNNAESTETVDRIVATVNDDIITLFDLNKAMASYIKKIKSYEYSLEKEQKMIFKIREDVLNQLIDKKLSDQEIEKLNIKVEENEIDNAIERIKSANLMTDETLKTALSKEGISYKEYRQNTKEQIQRARLVNYKIKSRIVITKEDIEKYYNENIEDYKGDVKYDLSNIIMKLPPFADEALKNKVKEKMDAVIKKLNEGESFNDLAKSYSESNNKDSRLGAFKLSELSEEIAKAIKDLKAKEFSAVIDTDYGYQIFFVNKIITIPGKSLDDVSKEISEKLYNKVVNEKFKIWLKELREQSHLKIIK